MSFATSTFGQTIHHILDEDFSVMVTQDRFFFFNHNYEERKRAYFGRVSSDDNYRVFSHVTRLQHEHIFMNFNCPTRE